MFSEKLTGKYVYIRTAGAHWVGRLIYIDPLEAALENATWVADTKVTQQQAQFQGLPEDADLQHFKRPQILQRSFFEAFGEYDFPVKHPNEEAKND